MYSLICGLYASFLEGVVVLFSTEFIVSSFQGKVNMSFCQSILRLWVLNQLCFSTTRLEPSSCVRKNSGVMSCPDYNKVL